MTKVNLCLQKQRSTWLTSESDVIAVKRISVLSAIQNLTILERLVIKTLRRLADIVVMK